MPEFDPIRYKAATEVFKLALKTQEKGMHRTLNREPKGKGWIPAIFNGMPSGMMCRPDKLNEAIEYFKIAYEIHPDIVALNQIALAYEMLGINSSAKEYFIKMKKQAENENNQAYIMAAEAGLKRTEN